MLAPPIIETKVRRKSVSEIFSKHHVPKIEIEEKPIVPTEKQRRKSIGAPVRRPSIVHR